MYSPYLLPLPSPDAPPYGPGLAPLRGAAGRLRDALVRRVVTGIFERTALPGVNARRAHHGLAPLERFGELLARPPLLLCLTAEGFEYPRGDWPANVRLVGPVNWSPPLPPTPGRAPFDALPDPLVLVTCSTERQADGGLIETALRALPGAGFSVIATTAAHDPEAFAAPQRTPGGALHRSRRRARARGLRRVPRRYGHHPESPRRGRAGGGVPFGRD
ncbi:MAG: hypothetical protein JO168_22110 [Solirubrobacterales bacterium]|nr:hypothetical protein [Solirubrobacterales bacterium]